MYVENDDPALPEVLHPHNIAVPQRPAVVAVVESAAEAADALARAAREGLQVYPQASGHGAGARIGNETMIVDVSHLNAVTIDPVARVARVGAGATWSAVNAAAEKHGLLGLAGTSPTVAVGGYAFGGGIGFLTRPHGMASSSLRSVTYLTADGVLREAREDAPEGIDREALWAFRGGGGVGLALSLEFDLFRPDGLHAGYLLWPVTALRDVAQAWAEALATSGPAVSSTIGVLHAPDAPMIPEELRGQPVVHLALASSRGDAQARPMLEAVAGASTPTVSTWGPADAARLAQIHLDPPDPVPALGVGRWLDAGAAEFAADILAVGADPASPVLETEIRHVANDAVARAGAETRVPGPFLLHAVGMGGDPAAAAATEAGLAQVLAAARPADIGQAAASFAEGREAVADALAPVDLERLRAVRRAVDPEGTIRPTRWLAD